MQIQHVTFEEAQNHFDEFCHAAITERVVIVISRRGGEDVALIPKKELSALVETLYLLGSEKNATRLLTALRRTTRAE